MKIFPAIDIIGGEVVRLYRGDYGQVTKYSLSVWQAAQSFRAAGAKFLHAVDLDGAKSGRAENAESVKQIVRADLFVEVGGGVRGEEQLSAYLRAGASRVILGTAAVKDFPFVEYAAKKYGAKIAVGVDAAEGKVAVNGWREITDIEALPFCQKLQKAGVKCVIYTDISRDGALAGANIPVYQTLAQIKGLEITASGGVSSLQDIAALKACGVHAAILGRALYEHKIDLAEAIAAAE